MKWVKRCAAGVLGGEAGERMKGVKRCAAGVLGGEAGERMKGVKVVLLECREVKHVKE